MFLLDKEKGGRPHNIRFFRMTERRPSPRSD